MKNATRIGWAVALALLAGCAHTVRMPLQPSFESGVTESKALATVRPALRVGRGEFTDSRTDTTRLATFQQAIHTFNLYADRPMQDVLAEGLGVVLTRAGHTFPASAEPQVVVNTTLLSVQAARNAGMIAVGASSSVQVKLDFVEMPSRRLIHSGVYNGSDKRSQALVGLMGMVRASLDQSIINCMNEVGADEKLASALRGLAASN